MKHGVNIMVFDAVMLYIEQQQGTYPVNVVILKSSLMVRPGLI